MVVHRTKGIVKKPVPKFDWRNALIDAIIKSGVTFFSTLGGGSVAGIEVLAIFEVAGIAAGAQFFLYLAFKRGIVQK